MKIHFNVENLSWDTECRYYAQKRNGGGGCDGRKKVNVLRKQNTKWKGKKARELGNGYKVSCTSENGKRNEMGIELSRELKEGVIQVNRQTDRVMLLKLEVNKTTVNIISAYTPQVGCEETEKDSFWKWLGTVTIPQAEETWIGADLNGHT